MNHFTALQRELIQYLSDAEIKQIRKAYQLAKKAHAGQKRQSGEAYITHPISVAMVLAEMRMDRESIMAALLHDVLEDTDIDKATLVTQFGEQVAVLVDGVTKLAKISFGSQAEAQAESFRKMILAVAKDIRVILVKLADRLHNMKTLSVLSRAKRKRIAQETLEIYAPLANRLGMHNFRIQFEELGFAAMYPLRYRALSSAVQKALGLRREALILIESRIITHLQEHDITVKGLVGRKKHVYSIYKKMRGKRLPFSAIMDMYGFRIIVDSVDACYRVLGIVHNLYKPLPERFKDYIAMPKVNGYQSLHTTLFGPYGVPIEIQIRTERMDQIAECGITAHWVYKTDEEVSETQIKTQEWLKSLLEIQRSTGNSLEFIENVKIDLFPDEVYVFTPKGTIMELPAGATVIDFAYAVHSDIGNNCVAAKIDRRLAPLSTQLTNGKTVEIITAPGARPNPSWLNFVVTGKARSNIRHFIKSQKRAESISLGKHLLEEALRYFSTSLADISQQQIDMILLGSNLESLDDLFETTGLGQQMPLVLAQRLTQQTAIDSFSIDKSVVPAIKPLAIMGSEGILVNFADCCRPIPGDPIVGVLKSGQGLEIHIERCQSLGPIEQRGSAYFPVCWQEKTQGEFKVELTIEASNQRGALASIAVVVAESSSNIEDITLEERDLRHSKIRLVITVSGRKHLASIIRRLRQVTVVNRISRSKYEEGL